MKTLVLFVAFVMCFIAPAYAEEKVYTEGDLEQYQSPSDGGSGNSELKMFYDDRKDAREQYYQDRREGRSDYYEDRRDERGQYYDDKKQTQKDLLEENRRLIADRERRREQCKSDAKSQEFWCKSNDHGCKSRWIAAYNSCNYIQ